MVWWCELKHQSTAISVGSYCIPSCHVQGGGMVKCLGDREGYGICTCTQRVSSAK